MRGLDSVRREFSPTSPADDVIWVIPSASHGSTSSAL
jgi:hypothetical protein